jgi:uracil-DNA glycosylase
MLWEGMKPPAGWPLDYWNSKEWLDVQDKLDRMEEDAIPYNPYRKDILRALRLTPIDRCRVCIVGESPYPNPNHATGVAFSSVKGIRVGEHTIPYPITAGERRSIPASLRTLFRELQRDLSTEYPSNGCLEGWCSQGVLLWNATPTCEIDRQPNGCWKAYTHEYWPEWPPLTQEIIERLSALGGIVFVFFGKKAAKFAKYVDQSPGYNSCLIYRHPSPLATRSTSGPIAGSRLFSHINSLVTMTYKKEAIDWRLT